MVQAQRTSYNDTVCTRELLTTRFERCSMHSSGSIMHRTCIDTASTPRLDAGAQSFTTFPYEFCRTPSGFWSGVGPHTRGDAMLCPGLSYLTALQAVSIELVSRDQPERRFPLVDLRRLSHKTHDCSLILSLGNYDSQREHNSSNILNTNKNKFWSVSMIRRVSQENGLEH